MFGSLFGKKSSQRKPVAGAPSISQLKAQMAHEDALVQRVLDAGAACKGAPNLAAAIDEYEAALKAADSVGYLATHWIYLAQECVKDGQHDRAWGILNQTMLKAPDKVANVRHEQLRILKKECRWDEALRTLGMEYASKYGDFNRSAFMRDLKPIANKLGLTDGERDQLADVVEKAKKSNGAEGIVMKAFTKFLAGRT